MAKAVLICGKLCSGKSTYAKRLQKELNTPVLSCDELMLALFPEQLGDRHEEIAAKARGYLLERAAELLALNVSVILDWGFWTEAMRRETEQFFRERGFATQWHYVQVSDETWRRNIAARNESRSSGTYFVDENLAQKCLRLFQPPAPEETDVQYLNDWTE